VCFNNNIEHTPAGQPDVQVTEYSGGCTTGTATPVMDTLTGLHSLHQGMPRHHHLHGRGKQTNKLTDQHGRASEWQPAPRAARTAFTRYPRHGHQADYSRRESLCSGCQVRRYRSVPDLKRRLKVDDATQVSGVLQTAHLTLGGLARTRPTFCVHVWSRAVTCEREAWQTRPEGCREHVRSTLASGGAPVALRIWCDYWACTDPRLSLSTVEPVRVPDRQEHCNDLKHTATALQCVQGHHHAYAGSTERPLSVAVVQKRSTGAA
jgi:hypothetical protein